MIRSIIVAAIALAWPAATVQAQDDCAAFNSPARRAYCYRNDQKTQNRDGRIVTRGPDGKIKIRLTKWNVQTDTSKLDDTPTVVLQTYSDEPLPAYLGTSSRGELVIRCMENTTSIHTKWGGHFMADIQGLGRVSYRIDDMTASSSNMVPSSNHEALGLWNGGSSIPFIKSMLGASTFLVRATPLNESPMEMSFDISGLDVAIAPLRDACGW